MLDWFFNPMLCPINYLINPRLQVPRNFFICLLFMGHLRVFLSSCIRSHARRVLGTPLCMHAWYPYVLCSTFSGANAYWRLPWEYQACLKPAMSFCTLTNSFISSGPLYKLPLNNKMAIYGQVRTLALRNKPVTGRPPNGAMVVFGVVPA